ncbi:MAG: hypothetical protein ABI333_09895 [bacterium]
MKWDTERVEQLIPGYAGSFDTSCRIADSDWDGIPDPYDCDPHNPFLTVDTDLDGACDRPISVGHELECEQKCADILSGIGGGLIERQAGWTYPVCLRNCSSTAAPDNCVLLSDPACAFAESIEDINDQSWQNVLNLCAQRYSNPGCISVDITEIGTRACEQPDTDGDGVGDQCQHHTTPPVVDAHSHRGISIGSVGSSGELQPISCRLYHASIDFDARGIAWREGFLRPTTVGVCACNPTHNALQCETSTCTPAGTYANQGLFVEFDYAPVPGCNQRGSAAFSNLMTQAGETFKVYDDLCRFKDVEYRPEMLGQEHVAIDWPWQRQNKFAPPDLEDTEYPWNSAPDRLELRNSLSVVRVEYPQPDLGADLTDPSWYPGLGTGNFVTSDFLPAGTFDDSDPGCDWLQMFLGDFELPNSDARFIAGTLAPDDLHLAKRPGSWVMLEDPLTGDFATMTLRTGALQPSELRLVSTETGFMPNLDAAVFAGAQADTQQLNLSHPAESVVFAYSPGSGSAGELPEPPNLYLGLVDRETNQWLSWEELFGPTVAVPRVTDPQIFFSNPQNAVFLLGETTDASGILRPNTLVRMSLADGSVSSRRMDWLGELADHTAAYDAGLGQLVIVGGSRTSPWSEQPNAVSEVWIYDLGSGGHYRLPTSRLAQARIKPGLALDGRHRRALVVGGRISSGASQTGAGGLGSGDGGDGSSGVSQTDAWQVNLITGEWTFLGDGSAVLPQDPGSDRPFAMYDPRRNRLWFSPARSQVDDYKLSIWELDLALGVFEEQRLLSNPTLDDQIRDGREAIRAFTADVAAPYGQIHRARIVSSEPHLRLAVQDVRGNTINQSLDGPGEPTVAWSAVPGEIYRLVVSTAPGYPQKQSATFRLAVEEASLVDVGSYTTDWSVQKVAVVGQTAYLSTREGLEAISIAEPAAPVRLSRLPLGNKGRGLAAVGRWVAYVRGPGNNGLKIIDARDPTQMALVGEAFSAAVTFDVALRGRTAYLAQGPFGVGVVDFTIPSSPVPVETLATTDKALAVTVHEHVLYVAQRDRAIQTFRLTAQEIEVGGIVLTSEVPVSLRVHGSKLLVAEINHVQANKCFAASANCSLPSTVEVFDISDPAFPLHEATLPFGQVEAWFGRHMGAHLLIPASSGFAVRAVAVQP